MQAGVKSDEIMLHVQLKHELLDLFHDDEQLLNERVKGFSEKTKAVLRTTRLGSRTLLPGEEPPVVHRAGSGALGKGLFANKDFDKGEFVTMFPIDCTLYKDGTSDKTLVCYSKHVKWENVNGEAAGDVVVRNRRFTHLVAENGMPLSMALPLDQSESSPSTCVMHMGHWADDAAALDHKAPNQKLAAKEYSEASWAAANAVHLMIADGIFVWTIATKPIKKGEEIFVTHGLNWWKSWHLCNESNTHANTHATVVEEAANEEGAPALLAV